MKLGHIKLKFKRLILIIGILALCTLGSYIIVSTNIKEVYNRYLSELESGVHAVRNQYVNTLNQDGYYLRSMYDTSDNIVGLMAFDIAENGYTRETTEELSNFAKSYVQGYYFEGAIDAASTSAEGKLYSLYNYRVHENLPLSPNDMYILLKDGHFVSDDRIYSSHRVDSSSYTIIGWNATEILMHQSILSAFPNNLSETILRINATDNLVMDSNTEDYIGLRVDEIISDFPTDLSNDKYLTLHLNDGKKITAYLCHECDDAILISFLSYRDLVPILLRKIAIPILLTWIFMLLIMGYVLTFMKPHDKDKKDSIEYLHLYKDYYTDRRLVSHTTGLCLMAVIIVIVSVVYMQSLINYYNLHINSTYNLNTLKSFVDVNHNNNEKMVVDFIDSNGIISDIISDYYLIHSDKLSDNNLITLRSYLPSVREITLFDSTGTIQYDTGNYIGYTLSHNENANEYASWDVLNGISSHVGYYASDFNVTLNYNILSRRQDKEGLVRITINGENLYMFETLCNINQTINSTTFVDSYRGYILKDQPDTLYICDQDEIHEYSNILDEKTLTDGYNGLSKINNVRYLLNIAETNDYYLLSATPLTTFNISTCVKTILCVIITLLLEQLVILLLSIRRKDDEIIYMKELSNVPITGESLDANMMDADFRNIFFFMILAACVTTVALLAADFILSKISLMGYLFGSEWPKGINLFSLTMIIIIIAIGIIGSKILCWLIVFFTKNMGPRGLTIGRMASSVVRFIMLITVFILILVNIGANTTSLLAGAGIAGAAISLCAQQTVNDLLSGFLIVFENLFNIGDWITVNDFRGQVIDIGIRITKLQKGEKVMLFNNSQLRDVEILEKNFRGCLVYVDIAYKEDANLVIDLIKANKERYQREIPTLTDGPTIDGITDLNSSGVTLRIWALTQLEKIDKDEREIRRITKNILDENSIEIPFTQVTISELTPRTFGTDQAPTDGSNPEDSTTVDNSESK